MANKERGELSVTVGGKEYTLLPNPNSMCELEEIAGKPLHLIMQGIQEGRLSGVRAVTWCLLHEKHKKEIKTLEDATNWIMAAGGFDVVMEWLQECFQLNEPPEASPAVPQEAQSGTGEPNSSGLVGSA